MMFSGIQTKVWTLMIQRDLIIPSLIIFDDPKGISIGNEVFDNSKVYGDTSIFDGLVQFVFHLRQCLLNEPEQFEPE